MKSLWIIIILFTDLNFQASLVGEMDIDLKGTNIKKHERCGDA